MRQIKQCISALKDSGIKVYMPAVHEGICTAPYCVVQYLGAYPEGGALTGTEVLRIHIYAPLGHFFALDELKHRAEEAMSPLVAGGALRPCEGVGACTVSDTYKAYACYLDYRVQYGLNA